MAADPALLQRFKSALEKTRREPQATADRRVEVGGETLNLARQDYEGAVMPQTEQLILWCDVLISGQKIPAREFRSVLVVSDWLLWPGLVRARGEQLAPQLQVVPDGAWARLRGANQ